MLESRDIRISLGLFCLLLSVYLLVYVNHPDSIDGAATLAVPVSLVQHGIPDMAVLGASDGLLPAMSRMGSFGRDGELYTKKGVTPSLFLMPLVAVAQIAPWLPMRATAMLLNPLITAATGAALYLLLRQWRFRRRTSLTVSLLYGLATLALVYSKTLFGEPLAALLLVLALVGIEAGRSRYLMGAGLVLGLCCGVNVSYAVLLPLFILYALGANPRRWFSRDAFALGLPILGVGLCLLAYNALRFGSPFESGYNFAEGEGFTHPILWGFFGLTVSPYRGVFWYNPILLLAIPGGFSLARRMPRRALLLITVILAQALVYSAWWSWHGGIVWGARFLVPVLPFLALFLTPVVETLFFSPSAIARRLTLFGLGFLTFVSIGVQSLGALYDYQHYVGYLYANYGSGRVEGLISGLADELLFNPALSPIVGHASFLTTNTPLDPALVANGLNIAHLLAALLVFAVGLLTLRPILTFQSLWMRRAWQLARIAAVILALNIVVSQQINAPTRLRETYQTALQPADTIVTALSQIGDQLIDLDTGARSFSTIAPTSPDDLLAKGIWQTARSHGGAFWFVTWFAPAQSDNWQEWDLWQAASFVREQVFEGNRALLFDAFPHVPLNSSGGWIWNEDTALTDYGLETSMDSDRGIWVRVGLRWQRVSAEGLPDRSWFVHLLNRDGAIVAQQDRVPQGGYRMTSTWTSDPVEDYLTFVLPSETDLTGWQIRIGWVDPLTGQRLPLTSQPADSTVIDGAVMLPVSLAPEP